ncbi:MAG: hypothetical protein ACLFWR_13250, partial [Acidimicrobiales bacterium]
MVEQSGALGGDLEEVAVEFAELGEGVVALDVKLAADRRRKPGTSPVGVQPLAAWEWVGRGPVERHAELQRSWPRWADLCWVP